jgi:hypothetical protein
LEAELGVRPNGRAEPDFLGYEVKQHTVTSFERIHVGTITLMTPEPTGGVYVDDGPSAFVRRFGYADQRGRADRLNFGGIHKVGTRHSTTGLTLSLLGYANGVITEDSGCVALVDDNGVLAATWDFAGLMHHWTRKHAHAVYVPSSTRNSPFREYCFGARVRVAEQPDFLHFLKAFHSGQIYYDPGIKLEGATSNSPTLKRRSQFRIRSADLNSVYRQMETVSTCG